MEVMIGVDPHKGSHTATMLDRAERELTRIKVRAGRRQVAELLEWADGSRAADVGGGVGRRDGLSAVPAARRRRRDGAQRAGDVGVTGTGAEHRPVDQDAIRTMPTRSPSPPCGPRRWRRCGRLITSRCAGCWSSITPIWPAGGTSCAAGCMPSSASWCPAGSTKKWSSTRHDHCSTSIEPDDVAAVERHRQAVELVAEIDHLDVVMRDSRARITPPWTASATTLREIFGVGPIVACMLIGYSGDPTRFDTASRYAAYTGTAPIEFSSGGRVTHRLSRRGNRRLNHALHIAAITQIRYPHSPGRRYYDRKLAEGKTPREAIRALKRRLSDVVWRHLVADARRAASADQRARAGHFRNVSVACVTGSHLNTGSSAKSLPRP